jgi:hypothetical protein
LPPSLAHSTHQRTHQTDHTTALSTRISLDWRTGVAATDWDTIAKKEHLDALSVEMRKVRQRDVVLLLCLCLWCV